MVEPTDFVKLGFEDGTKVCAILGWIWLKSLFIFPTLLPIPTPSPDVVPVGYTLLHGIGPDHLPLLNRRDQIFYIIFVKNHV